MRLLLLGGTLEARKLACRLVEAGHEPLYSLAGRTANPPPLPCPIRRGGFGGVAGLVRCLRQESLQGIVDATHPFAVTIQRHAVAAAEATGLPLWRWERPPWRPAPGDHWHEFPDPETLLAALENHQRILFTVGASAYRWPGRPRAGQRWFVRALHHPSPLPPGIEPVSGRGPFTLASERALLARLRPEVLVSKHSGGEAVAAKLIAAREAGIPVFLVARPPTPASRKVATIDALLRELARSHARDDRRLARRTV